MGLDPSPPPLSSRAYISAPFPNKPSAWSRGGALSLSQKKHAHYVSHSLSVSLSLSLSPISLYTYFSAPFFEGFFGLVRGHDAVLWYWLHKYLHIYILHTNIYTHIHMYVCRHTRCVDVVLTQQIPAHIHICNMHTNIYTHIHICMCVDIYVALLWYWLNKYLHIYIHAYKYIHAHSYTHVCRYTRCFAVVLTQQIPAHMHICNMHTYTRTFIYACA